MGVLEIILISVCAALVVGVTVTSIIRKKQGKSSCGCDCDCCHCSGCSSKPKSTKN